MNPQPEHLVVVEVLDDEALDLLAGNNDGDVVRLDRGVGLGRSDKLGRASVHGDSLRVGEAVRASATRNNEVAEVALVRGVLVEDGVPVGLDVSDAARDDLVVDADGPNLGKVLEPVGARVAGGGGRVLVVVALPLVGGAEGLLESGQGVPVQAVGNLVDHGGQVRGTLDDAVSVGESPGGSAVVETGSSNQMTFQSC